MSLIMCSSPGSIEMSHNASSLAGVTPCTTDDTLSWYIATLLTISTCPFFLFQYFADGLKKKLADTCTLTGPLILLFWTSGNIASGFQNQSEQTYSHVVAEYVMYIASVSPLVQHLATSSRDS